MSCKIYHVWTFLEIFIGEGKNIFFFIWKEKEGDKEHIRHFSLSTYGQITVFNAQSTKEENKHRRRKKERKHRRRKLNKTMCGRSRRPCFILHLFGESCCSFHTLLVVIQFCLFDFYNLEISEKKRVKYYLIN